MERAYCIKYMRYLPKILLREVFFYFKIMDFTDFLGFKLSTLIQLKVVIIIQSIVQNLQLKYTYLYFQTESKKIRLGSVYDFHVHSVDIIVEFDVDLSLQLISKQFAELYWKLHHQGWRIAEYPIEFVDKTHGENKLPKGGIRDCLKVDFSLVNQSK